MVRAEPEALRQERRELFGAHLARGADELAVFDPAATADVSLHPYVKRRIKHGCRGALAAHQLLVGVQTAGVADEETMRPEAEQVAQPRNRAPGSRRQFVGRFRLLVAQ